MRSIHVLAAAVLVAMPVRAAGAESIGAAIRADNWGQAAALAALQPDPLASRLVTYYRLLTPGGARAAEIAAFMVESPDWPQQGLLSRRLQEALAVDKDDRTVLEICRQRPPTAVPSLLRCADAAERSPSGDGQAEHPARRAWLLGITVAGEEAAFLRRWGGLITAEDQWRRFDRLAWAEATAPGSAAARQAVRVAPGQRAGAEARLALKRDDATAPSLVAALPEGARGDAALTYELARWYRRAGQDRDAARVWTGGGVQAEGAAAAERRGAYWDERNLLARRLLRANEAGLAYTVVAAPAAGGDGAIDQAFLAGWIALRRLNDPVRAGAHFSVLATLSRAAITQSRAHYWMGRALEAGGDGGRARAAYAQAAAWPTTYYGQLAGLALGEMAPGRLAGAQDPPWTTERALGFLAQDAARVAVLLAAWGEPRRARPFIQRLDELAPDATERALAARLALGLGLPDQAVAVARRAGRDGVMLPGAGWPSPFGAGAEGGGEIGGQRGVEQAVVLGLIRQESSFDVQAASPVGARGLMQLMPGTAAAVARKLGVAANVAALTTDAAYNMRLGTAYLRELLVQFDGALPLALAGYNAGPGRVRDWLVAQDPAAGPLEMIDWIELIPFNETRNYVQRVIENIVVYRSQLGVAAPHPVGARAQDASGPAASGSPG